MRRSKHPDKEIEAAILYAEENGWTYKDSGKSAHSWGRLLCPLHTREGHQMSIWRHLVVLLIMRNKFES